MDKNLTDAIAALTKESEQSLIDQIGRNTKMLQRDPAVAGQLAFAARRAGAPRVAGTVRDIRTVGNRILRRWAREVYAIVCGERPEDRADRRRILAALRLGEAGAATVIAGVLIGSMGLAPVLASAIAVIVARRFLEPAREELCAESRKWLRIA
jgi:hypothetical protein